MDITDLIGEATEYDKKQDLEKKKPKSWCKSVSAFSKLKERYKARTKESTDEKETVSLGLVDAKGRLTNVRALLADDSPIRWSRLFCTRWNARWNVSSGSYC